MTSQNPYGDVRELDCASDIAFEVRAVSLEKLFCAAAWSLFSVMVDLTTVRCLRSLSVRIPGEPDAFLLADWLNELIFLHETKRVFLSQFHMKIGDGYLEGTAHGETIDATRHIFRTGVKAVTYHDLMLRRTGEGYFARFVIDI